MSRQAQHIREKYGHLLTLEEVAEVLRYSSVDAVRQASSRGTLPVSLKRFPGRRATFVFAEDVIECLESMENARGVT